MIALLRGVTPVGKNGIPKMSYLVQVLQEAGLCNVQTYIQSGNVVFESNLAEDKIISFIHETIKEKIGADLSVILKSAEQLEKSCSECPFPKNLDAFRIHLVFTNTPIDKIDKDKLQLLCNTDFGEKLFASGTECLYMYLPKSASVKKLNTNFLEKKLGITATMRKLNVAEHLGRM